MELVSLACTVPPMASCLMHTVRGTVVVVQEQRFKLAIPGTGQALFVLAHDAPLDGQNLQRLADRQAEVLVRWRRLPGLVARLACDVRQAGAAAMETD